MNTVRHICALLAATVISAVALAQEEGVVEHKVRWYEDLAEISARYGVPQDVIITYNDLTTTELKARQILKIPLDQNLWNRDSSYDENEEAIVEEPDTLTPLPVDKVDFALLMPLISGEPAENNNNMDFYSGVLMAVRKCKEEGLDIRLRVFDYGTGLDNTPGVQENDFIIGPVKNTDVLATLQSIEGTTPVVSPLDSKTAKYAADHINLVQASATDVKGQFDSAVEWAQEYAKSRYEALRYIVVTSDADTASLRDVASSLQSRYIPFSVCSTSVQGDIARWEENALHNGLGRNIVILASTNEAILNNAIRNLSIICNHDLVTPFAIGKIRSYDTIPLEKMHKTGINVVCPYYVDYNDINTLEFIHSYRALFHTEPTQYSYQGYDLTCYMIHGWAKYGKNWRTLIPGEGSTPMLQANFKMTRLENGAVQNTGTRRLTYKPDCTVELVK